ncbi:MAG TPA: SRPBCC domain-containing protein [Thermomicrobiales bacterium]|jgi:uncharacterized protein YndB with AHSA1/START domain|nr:SRPBCC domain-containing protein [Thermomicrobiales bacterium]
MTVTVQDTIERQLVIPVGRQRVWEALTNPDRLSKWLCDQATVRLEPGAPIAFAWNGYGTTRGRVEVVEPPRHFAYSWAAAADTDQAIPFEEIPATLVEFTLEETPEGTRVTVIESGFAALPEDARDQALREHSEGWVAKTTSLLDYLLAESSQQ